MGRMTKRDLGGNPILNCDVCDEYCGLLPCRNQLIKLLAAYEEAEEQERLMKERKKQRINGTSVNTVCIRNRVEDDKDNGEQSGEFELPF